MAKDEVFPIDDDDDDVAVTLDLDDGSQVECDILFIYEVENQDYIALLPTKLNGEETDFGDDVYIYRYYEDENGAPSLDNIDDDDEYEKATDRFDEILDEQQFEDMD